MGAYWRGGAGRGLAYLFCKMVVSVIHKELEWKWKNSSTRSWRSCSHGSKTNQNFQRVNKANWISPNEVLQS